MANKVNNAFRDKFTKKVYKKGDSYSHKDEKRIAFLMENGYIEEVKQKAKEEKAGDK